MRSRNSGFAEGKFAERQRRRNPVTGDWYASRDFYVGASVTVSAMRFRIVRADEYSLKEMESGGDDFPLSDVSQVLGRLQHLQQVPEFCGADRIDPDELRDLAARAVGVELFD